MRNTAPQLADLPILDCAPVLDDFKSAVLRGLARDQKAIPPMFFYDAVGSRLFEEICDAPEYYPTRAELALMQTHGKAIADEIGRARTIIELGAGAPLKAQQFLKALHNPASYIAMDVSLSALEETVETLSQDFPALPVQGICADFSCPPDIPSSWEKGSQGRVTWFPGSTIGNLEPEVAEEFLRSLADLVGPNGGLLIGVDLAKDSEILNAAYNDAKGVTAKFNLNLLTRMRRELGAELDEGAFTHHAFFNEDKSCIEMHLRAEEATRIEIGDQAFAFQKGETIHTECSYKYTVSDFQALGARAGLSARNVWMDPNRLFSLHYLASA